MFNEQAEIGATMPDRPETARERLEVAIGRQVTEKEWAAWCASALTDEERE